MIKRIENLYFKVNISFHPQLNELYESILMNIHYSDKPRNLKKRKEKLFGYITKIIS